MDIGILDGSGAMADAARIQQIEDLGQQALTRIEQAFFLIDQKDQELRTALTDRIGTIQTKITEMTDRDNTLRNQLGTRIGDLETSATDTNNRINNQDVLHQNMLGRMIATENATQGLVPGDVGILQGILASLAGVTDVPQLFANVTQMASRMDAIQQQVQSDQNDMKILKDAYAGISRSGNTESSGFGKPIMDSKCWDNVDKLGDDRTKYRDWRMNMNGAFKQCSKVKGWKQIMDYFTNHKDAQIWDLTPEKLKDSFITWSIGIVEIEDGAVAYDKMEAE